MKRFGTLAAALTLVGATACTAAPHPGTTTDRPFTVTPAGEFVRPWAMAFIPGTSTALITEQTGTLHLRAPDGTTRQVTGTPQVVDRGQGGLGDVAVLSTPLGQASPAPPTPVQIYLTWVEAGPADLTGAVLGRATLDPAKAALTDLTILWRQTPKVSGDGHFSHRIAFDPDGQHLFLSSGDRQKFDPAQDPAQDLGKIIRMGLDGSNPEHWTLGHRNPLGLAFDPQGRLWSTEMGPKGGDELNLITRGGNYGWPRVSNGSHYDGRPIPDHAPGDGFVAPLASWDPSISPGSLIIYTGPAFPQWRGDAVFGALSGQALVVVDLAEGTVARPADIYPMGQRIREVERAPDGTLWLLEDGEPGRAGRLLHVTPAG
jgi:glucose/arabinose dehydrogenase